MSTVVIGAGGPRPQARIVFLREDSNDRPSAWAIVDENEVIYSNLSESDAHDLLPKVQQGA